ncbi:YafY family transcriptional regulator [Sedimentibacter sp. zth1]|uniref:helix-turn-helix transcriptional regulator n=1 Tax=Sedimentibacter sp. zth1 TaxID=2816908 RepID=UPI001A919880|nr:YafY family protein [Sedimentibacter sp. zth1]QSX05097.1 YafY family transcriptional regulator [Sedimentibacter sp. zth1]
MQINRLFEIVYILLDKKAVTAKELASHLEVSTRTIYRDIETLSSSGIPVYMTKGKGGGVSLLPNFVLNKTILTESEKADILSSLKAVKSVNFGETDTAINKLSSLFGESNSDWIEIDFSTWSNAEKEKESFNNIKNAILHMQIISFSYASGKGENTQRKVEPLKLCYKGSSWYLYGYCTSKCDYRFFKLRRMKNICILEETFNRKPPKHIFNNKNTFKEEFINLKLKLSSKMAFRVYDEFEIYTKLEDGSFIAEIAFPKGEWLFYYISSFGEHCELLEPVEEREKVKEKLELMLTRYSK